MGHRQAFTAVYAKGGWDMWDIPRDPHPIGSYVLRGAPVARIVKTIVYMGLRATLRCSTGSRLCNSEWKLFIIWMDNHIEGAIPSPLSPATEGTIRRFR
eukprot:6195327-Pleurochrysis_carterae.AAC.2